MLAADVMIGRLLERSMLRTDDRHRRLLTLINDFTIIILVAVNCNRFLNELGCELGNLGGSSLLARFHWVLTLAALGGSAHRTSLARDVVAVEDIEVAVLRARHGDLCVRAVIDRACVVVGITIDLDEVGDGFVLAQTLCATTLLGSALGATRSARFAELSAVLLELAVVRADDPGDGDRSSVIDGLAKVVAVEDRLGKLRENEFRHFVLQGVSISLIGHTLEFGKSELFEWGTVQIVDGFFQKTLVMFESTDGPIAGRAEKSPNVLRVVTVIDG